MSSEEIIEYPPHGSTAKECLPVLKILLDHPILRPQAFELVSRHCGPTINALMQARKYYNQSSSPRLKFSVSTEKNIVAFIVAQSLLKSPVSKEELMQFVTLYTHQTVSDVWIKDLEERYPTVIRCGTAGVEAKKRHVPELLADTEAFIDSFDHFQSLVPILPHTLMNVDEKRGGYSSDGGFRLLARGEFNQNIEQPRGVSLFTMLPFILADGKLFAIFYFFAEGTTDETVVWVPQKTRRARGEPHRFVALTPTSYLKGKHYQDACLQVADLYQQDYPGLQCTLLQDSVPIHCDLETVSACIKKNLMFHYLIKNATGVCQPLDVSVFGAWTSAFLSRTKEIKWILVPQKKRHQVLMACAYEVESLVFTSRVIKTGFKNAYIYPWRPADLRARMELETSKKAPPALDPSIKLAVNAYLELANIQKKRIDGLLKSVSPVKVSKNQNPKSCFDLVQAKEEQSLLEIEQTKEAEALKKKKEEDKRQREEKARQHTALMKTRKCAIDGCNSKRYKSTKWKECTKCKKFICPIHISIFSTHKCEQETNAKPRKKRRRR
jgi:hypothetical protein